MRPLPTRASINMDLVDAQQARRVLDRLVGYNLSPLLWRKVRSRLSAGRVQSVALRLIVEREREIDAFVPVEYWSDWRRAAPRGCERRPSWPSWRAIDGDRAGAFQRGRGQADAGRYGARPLTSSRKIKRGERRRKPSAPFTTSTLQQEASRRLGYTARRTMALAQQLYEGIDLGEGAVGLITYMRTDSTNVAELAQAEAREFIAERYGQNFLPAEPPSYTDQSQGRSGSARGHSPHLGPAPARPDQGIPQPRSVPPVPVDLAAFCGLADGIGGLRYALGGSHRQRRERRVSAARLRLHGQVPRLPGRLRRGQG